MAFMMQSMDVGQTPPLEYRQAAAEETVVLGEALVTNAAGLLTKCGATAKPEYVAAGPQDEQDMVMPETSLDERIIFEEQKDRLMQIWGSLPEEDQLLLEGKYILGYKDTELADMLGCTKDSIRMKLTRARRRAFQLMTEEEGDKL